jgi:hypothetical protein
MHQERPDLNNMITNSELRVNHSNDKEVLPAFELGPALGLQNDSTKVAKQTQSRAGACRTNNNLSNCLTRTRS